MPQTILIKNHLIVAAILVLALALRLFDLGDESLWLDEAYSWWDAQQSLGALWHLVPQCDPHPPLYAVLLKGWVALFGDDIAWLRGLSVLFNLLAVCFVYLAGREINPRVGWIAALLFALAPFQIEYSQETRPYTLVGLGGALLLYGLMRLLPARNGSSRAGWAALIAGGCISLWSNSTSIFIVASAGLTVMGLLWLEPRNRKLGRGFVLAGVIVGLLWLPYLPTLLHQAQSVSADFWIPRPDNWWRIFNELRFLLGFESFRVLWALLPLWAIGIYLLWRDGKKTAVWLLLGLLILPGALNLAASLAIKPVFLARAMSGFVPAFTVALAAAFAGLNHAAWRHGVLIVYAAGAIYVANQALYGNDRKEPWEEIAVVLSQKIPADSLLLTVPNELALPLGYALGKVGKSFDIHGVPADFPAPGLSARYPSGKCAPSVPGQDVKAALRMAEGRRNLLFFTRKGNIYDPHDEVRPLIEAAGFREVEVLRFTPGAIEAYRYEASKVMQVAK
jgi:mannosyltransferase